MVIWRGQYYKRSDGSFRSRSSGAIYRGVTKINNVHRGINKLGIEPIRTNPYGSAPRSSSQAIRDIKSFHQKVPRLLKR